MGTLPFSSRRVLLFNNCCSVILHFGISVSFSFCFLVEMEFNSFLKAASLFVIVAIISADYRADAEPLPSKERRALPPCYLQCPHEECANQCSEDRGTWIALNVECFSRCNPECMREKCNADV